MKTPEEFPQNSAKLTTTHASVIDLPDDIIFLILSYLDIPSLGVICRTCSKLRDMSSSDCVWLTHKRQHWLINDNNVRQRHKYSLKDKCRISVNWENRQFHEFSILKSSEKLIPWLHYEDHDMFISKKNCIQKFQVQRNGHLQKSSCRIFNGPDDDICRFIVKDNLVVCGCRNGTIFGWETSSGCLLFNYEVHSSDAQCVGIVDDLVISGSRDSTVKVSSMQPDGDGQRLKKTIDIGARVWSLAVSPSNSIIATGSSRCHGAHPLSIWDLTSGNLVSHLGAEHRRGAGVLDIKFETPYTLLTGGYDTNLRLWDLRTDTCVLTWEEPFDTAIYCIATDYNNTMVTGTARYGMTRIWDKRSPTFCQLFFSGSRSSPVYSLALDWRRMYVALDRCTNVIDFT